MKKSDFICFGTFYNIDYGNNIEKCRSELDIYLKNFYESSEDKQKVDAIFVMMNPGSSEPINKSCSIKDYTVQDICKGSHTNNSVQTKPDTTQFQLMKIMDKKNWSHIKVINLSDIREPKSKIFCRKINVIKQYDPDNIHSIFSDKRKNELKQILNSSTKIIVAWGVNSRLRNLIKLALESNGGNNLNNRVGWNKKMKLKNDFYYYHPLPRYKKKRKQWIKVILSKV